jgi:hypothetical protein
MPFNQNHKRYLFTPFSQMGKFLTRLPQISGPGIGARRRLHALLGASLAGALEPHARYVEGLGVSDHDSLPDPVGVAACGLLWKG